MNKELMKLIVTGGSTGLVVISLTLFITGLFVVSGLSSGGWVVLGVAAILLLFAKPQWDLEQSIAQGNLTAFLEAERKRDGDQAAKR